MHLNTRDENVEVLHYNAWNNYVDNNIKKFYFEEIQLHLKYIQEIKLHLKHIQDVSFELCD